MNKAIKGVLVLVISLIISSTGIGQTVYDIKSAKAIALAANKLIILDFGASWCRPCLAMERELWQSKAFDKLSNKFVLVKIDVTDSRALTTQYNVQRIPKVIVMTANEDQLMEKTGFKNAISYLNILKSFPESYGDLSQKLTPFLNKGTATSQDFYNLAEEYRKLASKIEDDSIKNQFLLNSKLYFKKCEKISDSKELEQMAILSQLRNDAYLGKYKKTKKKLNNTKFDQNYQNVYELKNFVLAYCHKQEGNLSELKICSAQIEDQELLLELK